MIQSLGRQHVVNTIVVEGLRFLKYTITTPINIFLALFPIISVVLLASIGIQTAEKQGLLQREHYEASPAEAAQSQAFNRWLNGGTVKEDLYRWYGYTSLALYLLGTGIRLGMKKIGREIKPWSLKKKLKLFSGITLISYTALYLLFYRVEGALPWWVVGIVAGVVLCAGWISLCCSHGINTLIAGQLRIQPHLDPASGNS